MKPVTDKIVDAVGQVLMGKEPQIRLALACLLARGHLLIEDLPGMGKTTLAHTLAAVLGLDFSRVQFTSDLLPADILGVSVYNRDSEQFRFHPGPVFNQLLLADEINRTTPKTQSALLEAMAEQQVTIEGETRELPTPFFVIATQNPTHQSGTFPLPESQLDRFLMRLSLGYPDQAAERKLLSGLNPRSLLKDLQPVIELSELLQLQQQVEQVKASASLLDYLQRLTGQSRSEPGFEFGVSPRGSLAWLHSARAWALLEGRDYVIPEDLQQVAEAVLGHRLRGSNELAGIPGSQLVEKLLDSVDIV
ncbi:MoxR family ATPase [Porticoccus sp. W117]|uniref:AAA family ATPase n=1 Tax=Porticoccus sp. W117 TaxID=3054777 RepID=UPI00259356D2|nr:MoxR family ATPase [Porticoccus sp. W117]MDM3871138.1 MoxR family ATPase [Porticoccus sp. W117]